MTNPGTLQPVRVTWDQVPEQVRDMVPQMPQPWGHVGSSFTVAHGEMIYMVTMEAGEAVPGHGDFWLPIVPAAYTACLGLDEEP